MGVIIIKEAVKREDGKLYYIDKEGNICEAVLTRRKRKMIKNE